MRVNVYACHVLMMSLSCEVDVKCCNAKDSEYVYVFDSQIRAFTTRSRHALPPDARLPSAEILALQTSKCTTAVSYMLQPAGQQHDNDTATLRMLLLHRMRHDTRKQIVPFPLSVRRTASAVND